MLCGTQQLLRPLRQNHNVKKWERQRSKVIFFNFYFYFLFSFGGGYKCGVQTWKDWEINGLGVNDVKFPRINKNDNK